MKLSDGEKIILVMLSDISKALRIDNGIDPEFLSDAIRGGHFWAIRSQFSGIFHGSEDHPGTVSEVGDILQMWEAIEDAARDLSDVGKARLEASGLPYATNPKFPGFDGNNDAEHLGIANFLVDRMNQWGFLKGRNLSGHFPMARQRDMVKAYKAREGAADYARLTIEQLIAILSEAVHPSSR